MNNTQTQEPPPLLDVDQPLPSLDWLQPDRTVRRYADNTTTGRARAWLPCHDDHSVTLPAAERAHLIRCAARHCGRFYQLWLHDDGGGDWTSEWTVQPYEKIHDSTPRYGPRPF
jgi:hypothetical protein